MTIEVDAPGLTPLGRVAIGDFIRRSAARAPGRVAIIDGEREVSYRALDEEANRTANFLIAQGLAPGDRVATLCANSAGLLVVIFGILKAGLVWVPLNTMLSPEDLGFIVHHSEVKALVADDQLLADPVRRAIFDQNGPAIVAIGEQAPAGIPHLTDAIGPFAPIEPEPAPAITGETLGLIMYTSGTTARPKGVMHNHLAVVLAALCNVAEFETRRGEVTSALLPLFHCAQFIGSLSSLFMGGTVVVMRKFVPGEMLALIEHRRLNRLSLLPAMYAALLAHPDREKRDLSSLRLCTYGMAPMPRNLLTELIDKFCPNFALGSGQTEMFPVTVVFHPEEQLQRFGNYWGTPSLLNDLAIMNDEGTLLPPGEVGEIVHRGPNVMVGYLKDDEATRQTRRHGWHQTGDIGVVDPDGQLLFLDRKKDIIKTGGENVASLKVEQTLSQHAGIAAVAVIGLPHPIWIEAVSAFVVPRAGHHITEQDILEYSRARLGAFEVPKVVVITENLPMTATGKVRKADLRSAHARHFNREA